MASRNYFSFLHIDSDYITPSIAQQLQLTTIPAALQFIQECCGQAEEKNQNEALKQLLSETSLLSQLAARAITESKEIPLVYEGFHLSSHAESHVADLLDVLLKMITATQEIGSMSTLCSALFAELTKTKVALERCSKTSEQWDDFKVTFRRQCMNTERDAA